MIGNGQEPSLPGAFSRHCGLHMACRHPSDAGDGDPVVLAWNRMAVRT